MDEPHSGQKWRRIGLPLSASLLNVLTIPRIWRAVLGRPTMMPNALPVNFWQSRQWHTPMNSGAEFGSGPDKRRIRAAAALVAGKYAGKCIAVLGFHPVSPKSSY